MLVLDNQKIQHAYYQNGKVILGEGSLNDSTSLPPNAN